MEATYGGIQAKKLWPKGTFFFIGKKQGFQKAGTLLKQKVNTF